MTKEKLIRVAKEIWEDFLKEAFESEFILAEGLDKQSAYRLSDWLTQRFRHKYPDLKSRGETQVVNSDKFGGKFDVLVSDKRDMMQFKQSLPALPGDMKKLLKPELLQKLQILGKLVHVARQLE